MLNSPIQQKYQEEIQSQVKKFEQKFEQFKQSCLELQNSTDQQISALDKADATSAEKEIDLKVELKKQLDLRLQQFELEMRRSFGDNLSALEEIYNQNNQNKLEQLEKSLQFV